MRQTMTEYNFFEKEHFLWDHFWKIFAPINYMYWSERNERNINVLQVIEFSFRDTLQRMKEEHAISKSMAATYWKLFCESSHMEKGAAQLLSQLHGHYKLGIITNGIGEAQRSRLALGKIVHYFDSLVISDEVGYSKPDIEIFEAAFSQLGVRSKDVLFVGDSLSDDYKGAQNAGIDFCYYNKKRGVLEDHIQPKFVVENLSDIKKLVR